MFGSTTAYGVHDLYPVAGMQGLLRQATAGYDGRIDLNRQAFARKAKQLDEALSAQAIGQLLGRSV
jgi:hypothetical protein